MLAETPLEHSQRCGLHAGWLSTRQGCATLETVIPIFNDLPPANPLNSHGKHILETAPPSAKSWFQQVRNLCSQYGLPNPLQLMSSPVAKEQFKAEVKGKIQNYWHAQLVEETSKLRSLKYFKADQYSLIKPHYMWNTAASNPFECSKSTVLARMVSGRYRTDMLCRHWNGNRSGFCRAPCCVATQGTLEHLLVACPALGETRERLYQMWLDRSVMFPTLHATVRAVLASADHNVITQFILEPLAFALISADFKTHGEHFAQQLSYMTRTFTFFMHREYQKLIKQLNNPTPPANHLDTNMLCISAARYDVDTPGHGHGEPASSYQGRVQHPGGVHRVPAHTSTVDAKHTQGCTAQQPSVTNARHFTNNLGVVTSAQCGTNRSMQQSFLVLNAPPNHLPGKHDLCDTVVSLGIGGDGALAGNSHDNNLLLPVSCGGCAGRGCGRSSGGACTVASGSFFNHQLT